MKEALFGVSLFPYLGFLWFLWRIPEMPRLGFVGFAMTLLFVAVTIPAGIYAQVHYGETLANVDWLHGGAESFLTLANVILVLGFRKGLREVRSSKAQQSATSATSTTSAEPQS
jgi:hypothetical protein